MPRFALAPISAVSLTSPASSLKDLALVWALILAANLAMALTAHRLP